ncbi:serine/threonine-protein phosphatase 6 regulatory ankyrin repeat subunit C isoform X2 [Hyalella azteca]|uniref:Serine/threonine-protein phosphatase 6 regulatory ankyrin repeat subunit C isoform X2 n=1 Tax=Hyalella azteca TaxID=294128 RepID=A0A8B7N0X0_HYAAZ|nr:serine/threonine-protein phosphatase 6 regulatory ankyrin repeat subunit C isoform X2 [Hyalella azteca]
MILESSAPWSSEKEMVFSKQFPLHHACRDSNTETLKRLLIQLQHNISNCNLVLSEDSEYGWTAAHFAAYFGSLECLRLLMQAGTMFNSSRESSGLPSLSCPLLSVTSKWKQTLLHVAAFADRPRCVQWLIARGLPVNAKDYNGETALHKACRTGSWECIHLLVSCNADASIRNHAGLNSADIAASCGHQDVCERLRQLVGESTPAATNGLKHLVSSNGYYGFSANNNTTAAGDDDEMETESDTSSPSSSTVQRPVTDVLVNDAVSQNLVPVAGRKRSREEDESSQAKRGRFQVEPDHPPPAASSSPRKPLYNITNGRASRLETYDDNSNNSSGIRLFHSTATFPSYISARPGKTVRFQLAEDGRMKTMQNAAVGHADQATLVHKDQSSEVMNPFMMDRQESWRVITNSKAADMCASCEKMDDYECINPGVHENILKDCDKRDIDADMESLSHPSGSSYIQGQLSVSSGFTLDRPTGLREVAENLLMETHGCQWQIEERFSKFH